MYTVLFMWKGHRCRGGSKKTSRTGSLVVQIKVYIEVVHDEPVREIRRWFSQEDERRQLCSCDTITVAPAKERNMAVRDCAYVIMDGNGERPKVGTIWVKACSKTGENYGFARFGSAVVAKFPAVVVHWRIWNSNNFRFNNAWHCVGKISPVVAATATVSRRRAIISFIAYLQRHKRIHMYGSERGI